MKSYSKIKIYTAILVILSLISCDQEEDQKGFFEADTIILNHLPNECSVKINSEKVFALSSVTEYTLFSDSTYNVNQDLNSVQGNWFSIFLHNNQLFIRTTSNNTGADKKLYIRMLESTDIQVLTIIQNK